MSGVLPRIVEETKADLRARKADVPLRILEERARRTTKTGAFAAAVRGEGVKLIAEMKAQSPSAGPLRAPYDPGASAKAYARAGAAALSVLTEPHHFGGDLAHLGLAAQAGIPLLQKDFIVDPYQVFEARANGADAVLLIVRILSEAELRELLGVVEYLALDALVEAHDAAELERALAAGARIVGVNSRNLDTLAVDQGLFDQLIPGIPKDRTVVAESGIKTAADVKKLRELGAHAMLVGEALLRQEDLEGATRPARGRGALTFYEERTMATKVKICGITNEEDATWAVNLGAHYVGLNFHKESPRKVSPEQAAKIAAKVPSFVTTVGVFVEQTTEQIVKIAQKANLGALQLHGAQTPEDCRFIAERLESPLIKVFRVAEEKDLEGIHAFAGAVQYLLLDARVEGQPGGTGETFPWALAAQAKSARIPVFLAGGLTAENVAEAIEAAQPFAVDVASGVEKSPKRKDYDKMKNFIEAAKYA